MLNHEAMRDEERHDRKTPTDLVGVAMQVRRFERREIIYSQGERGNTLLYIQDGSVKLTDQLLLVLSDLHFGRFSLFTEILWAILGLVSVILSITGVFLCCRRMIYKTSSPGIRRPEWHSRRLVRFPV